MTIDAMGCQRRICQQIIDQEADYVIGLKGNQGSLRKDVELFFDEHHERGIGGGFIKQSQTVDGDHGRIETRSYTVCTDTGWLKERHHWPGLKTVIMVEYKREIKDHVKTVRQFYIASVDGGTEEMSKYIRSHWQIENCVHRVMDVTFRQDECRIRTGNAAANFATIKHAAMNLLRRAPGKPAFHKKAMLLLGMTTTWRKLSDSNVQSIPLVSNPNYG